MAYNPPSPDNVNFSFIGSYTPPSGDNVNIIFGIVPQVTVVEVSKSNIYDATVQPGFNATFIKWTSSVLGSYQIEIGGEEPSGGYIVASGTAIPGIVMENIITDTYIESATTFSGTGTYEFNIYVRSTENIWNDIYR